MLLNASHICHICYQLMIPLWEWGDLSPSTCVIPPSLFWWGVAVLAQLFPWPAFLCLILHSARCLPAGPTCPPSVCPDTLGGPGNREHPFWDPPRMCVLRGNFEDVSFVFLTSLILVEERFTFQAVFLREPNHRVHAACPQVVVCKIKRFYLKIVSLSDCISLCSAGLGVIQEHLKWLR